MAAKVLPITMEVEIIGKKEFAKTVLDADNKIFVMHVATLLELTIFLIYSIRET